VLSVIIWKGYMSILFADCVTIILRMYCMHHEPCCTIVGMTNVAHKKVAHNGLKSPIIFLTANLIA